MPNIVSWDKDPVDEFQAFVRSPAFLATSRRRQPEEPALSASSLEVYTVMFQRFASWMAARRLVMSKLDSATLYAFLGDTEKGTRRKIDSGISRRYLRLIERCYEHLQVVPNPAQSAIFDAHLGKQQLPKDDEMNVLNQVERDAFRAALPDPSSWKRRRDRALLLLMLDGGVRVAEAVGFLTSEFSDQATLDGRLELKITPEEKHASCFPHSGELRASAVPEVLAWLEERKQLAIPGPLAFPSTLQGKKLSKSTLFLLVKATFVRAGIPARRMGGRTLRNTFAVDQLDRVTQEELTEQLGLSETRATEIYADAKRKLHLNAGTETNEA
jgi:site-specific recombinase XerD